MITKQNSKHIITISRIKIDYEYLELKTIVYKLTIILFKLWAEEQSPFFQAELSLYGPHRGLVKILLSTKILTTNML